MFGETTRSPISSAGTPHVTDAFPQSHTQNSPPDSRTVLSHFHCNPVLVAVVVCSSTAQTVFNTQKKKVYLQAPNTFAWLYLSRPSKNKRYLQNKYILCPVSYSGAVSAVFTADEPVQKDLVQLSCLMPDGRSGPFMDPSILKIQQVTTHLTGIRCLSPARDKHNGKCILLLPLPPGGRQLYKPHLDTAK